MGSAIKILFFLIFFGVWIFKIAKKFSETKNTQGQASYRPQRKEEIPQLVEEFPELDFEKKQETRGISKEPVYEADNDAVSEFLEKLNFVKEDEPQESTDMLSEQSSEETYIQPELVEDKVEEIPEEEFKKSNDSWELEEVKSTPSIGVFDARTGIVMSEILGKPIALR